MLKGVCYFNKIYFYIIVLSTTKVLATPTGTAISCIVSVHRFLFFLIFVVSYVRVLHFAKDIFYICGLRVTEVLTTSIVTLISSAVSFPWISSYFTLAVKYVEGVFYYENYISIF